MDRGAMPAAGGLTASLPRGNVATPSHSTCPAWLLTGTPLASQVIKPTTAYNVLGCPFLRPLVVLCTHSSDSRTSFTNVKSLISVLGRGATFFKATLRRSPGRCGSSTHSL